MSLGIVGNTIGIGTNFVQQPPIGAIVAWAKTLTGVPQTLPSGWVECDGSVLSMDGSPLDGETIPDLTGSKFLRGNATSGGTGGSATHAHTTGGGFFVDGGTSGSPVTGYTNSGSVSYGTTDADNVPPYYAVVWIMRVI
jgi:hypothetical protein